MLITPIDTSALDAGKSSTSTKSDSATDPSAMQDRFLKLLVAQLNNQDPMNPLDNAQMTTQMAQINTVTGIQTLNLTMQTMAEQFSAMQTLQGTAMIGRSVLIDGNQLAYTEGVGKGHFDLASAATEAKVEVVTPGGVVVDTVNLGALEKGRHEFEWDSSQYSGNKDDLRFRIAASNKNGSVDAATLMQAKVTGMGAANGGMLAFTLDSGGTASYSQIHAIH